MNVLMTLEDEQLVAADMHVENEGWHDDRQGVQTAGVAENDLFS